MENQITLKNIVRETQDKIKLRLYKHGTQARLSKRLKVSPYRIRQAVNGSNPNLNLLEKIEKALA